MSQGRFHKPDAFPEYSMTAIVEGVYKQGKIELLQTPQGLPEGRVRVILIAEADRPKPSPRMMTFGMYPGDTSTLEDFKDAAWHGEKEWDEGDGQ
jgi:hypothetical protein